MRFCDRAERLPHRQYWLAVTGLLVGILTHLAGCKAVSVQNIFDFRGGGRDACACSTHTNSTVVTYDPTFGAPARLMRSVILIQIDGAPAEEYPENATIGDHWSIDKGAISLPWEIRLWKYCGSHELHMGRPFTACRIGLIFLCKFTSFILEHLEFFLTPFPYGDHLGVDVEGRRSAVVFQRRIDNEVPFIQRCFGNNWHVLLCSYRYKNSSYPRALSLVYFPPLECRNGGVGEHSQQSSPLNSQFPLLAALGFCGVGAVLSYYGLWNLKLGPGNQLGFGCLLVGCVLFVYGLAECLKSFADMS